MLFELFSDKPAARRNTTGLQPRPHVVAGTAEPHRRGAILVLSAICLIIVMAMAAFAVDVGYMTVVSSEMQNAADAAALAAATRLIDGDAAVIAEAQDIATRNWTGKAKVVIQPSDVQVGLYDPGTRKFTAGRVNGNVNAVKVTARVENRRTFFGGFLNKTQFNMSRSAVAVLNPREIAFVVDLSGSMNDDTEAAWATELIEAKMGPKGFANVASGVMQEFYDSLNFGPFPGKLEWIGAPAGVDSDQYAYAVLTCDDGPLADPAMDSWYRINPQDDEGTRATKGYRWIMDKQLSKLMPQALPFPNSKSAESFTYWKAYLDYIIDPTNVGEDPPPPPPDPNPQPQPQPDPNPQPQPDPGPPPPPPPPPKPRPPGGFLILPRDWDYAARDPKPSPFAGVQLASVGPTSDWAQILGPAVTTVLPAKANANIPKGTPRRGSKNKVWDLPANQSWDRIQYFNNPNYSTFPNADGGAPYAWRNQLGYLTYSQFLMDFGYERSPGFDEGINAQPALGVKPQHSVESPYCVYHTEATAAGVFNFPASEQPTHALRRALIAGLDKIADMNLGLTPGSGDRVSIVTFDGVSDQHTPRVVQPLTGDFLAAMTACTKLQAVGDVGNTTATENGIILARQHLAPVSEGGAGRQNTTRVFVLLSDGVPNVWATDESKVTSFVGGNPSPNYYDPDYVWYNAPLMQTAEIQKKNQKMYPVGMGMGSDLDFMDRMARIAKTDQGGLSARGAGNPADYEAQLTAIFDKLLKQRATRLVQ